MHTVRRILISLLVLLVAGCGARGSGGGGGVTMEDGALVLQGASLSDGRGDLLGTLIGKVPNFRVRRIRGDCPQITLRNAVSYQSVVNPHVYVDGARATDTCILESLQAHDVERVEVYPTGVTNRPGYGRHAHGLILVFMRSGLPPAGSAALPPGPGGRATSCPPAAGATASTTWA